MQKGKLTCTKRLRKQLQTKRKKKRVREKLGDKLEAVLKRTEEDEATCLMEEMKKDVEAAQHRSYEAERSLCSALREYLDSYDKDQGRARTLMTKCCHSMQKPGNSKLEP